MPEKINVKKKNTYKFSNALSKQVFDFNIYQTSLTTRYPKHHIILNMYYPCALLHITKLSFISITYVGCNAKMVIY